LERVRQLIDERPPPWRRTATALRCLSAGMVAVTLAVTALVPVSVAAGVQQLGSDATIRHCLA
jgi:hypothetical protein